MAKPTIRFKGYTEDWEQRKLGDSDKVNGRRIKIMNFQTSLQTQRTGNYFSPEGS